jgi:hypothetical protein
MRVTGKARRRRWLRSVTRLVAIGAVTSMLLAMSTPADAVPNAGWSSFHLPDLTGILAFHCDPSWS